MADSNADEEGIVNNHDTLQDKFNFTPFDLVESKNARPRTRALLKKLEGDLERTVKPPLKDSAEVHSAIEQVQHEEIKFSLLRLGQSKLLYNAFKAIQESPDWATLSDAQKCVVEGQLKEAILKGVALADDKSEQFNKIEQAQFFLSEEYPSNVGLGRQDHLQVKPSWLLHSTGTGSDDFLPPGFEGYHPGNEFGISLSDTPLITWSCPYMIEVDAIWVVAAGDESKEVEILNQREMRVVEAVYPCPSAIPPNPVSSVDVENFEHNDWQTPLIPITPIEDEDEDTPLDSMEGFSSDKQVNLIDHDLLVKIPSNQNMIGKLTRDYGPAANQLNALGVGHLPNPPLPLEVVPGSSQPSAGAHLRDMNYYESSIQQHGGERQEQFGNRAGGVNQESLNKPKHRIVKPCLFFNSAKGCRNGSNCTYKHDDMSAKSDVKRRHMEGKDKILIQQHGGERQEQVGNNRAGENQESLNNPKPRIMKPCFDFDSAGGCGYGSNCRFQHDELLPKSKANCRHMEGEDKSLTQQHGGEGQELAGNNRAGGNQESLNNPRPRIMKPCFDFDSAGGCWYGSNCRFQHDELLPKSKAKDRHMEGEDKSLTQQHVGEGQELVGNNRAGANQESLNNPNPRIMKPCFDFDSARGCGYGSKCRFQHDESLLKSKAKWRHVEEEDKSLIQQHGGERQELVGNNRAGGANQESLNNPNARITKRCLFLNSAKGCKNGSNCTYQHDETSPKSKVKRSYVEGKDKSLTQQHGGERQERVGNNQAGGANQESLNNPIPRIMKPDGSNCTYQHDETSPKSKVKRRRVVEKDESLTQQHGGERQEDVGNNWVGGSNQESLKNPKPRIMKPCLFLNSAKGCRKGSNCMYQHDEKLPESKVKRRRVEEKDESLIQQHGGERQEDVGNNWAGGANQESLKNPKPRIMKPCLFLNSAKGCRKGLNCTYQHNETSPKSKVKRRRVEGEDKSLTQQLEGERQEQVGNKRAGGANQESLSNPNPRIMKPCSFYIAGVCNYGSKCKYQHDETRKVVQRHDETSPESKAKRRQTAEHLSSSPIQLPNLI